VHRDPGPCKSESLRPSSLVVTHRCDDFIQGLAEHQLRRFEKQAFFATLQRLAGKHARLPQSMVITDKINYAYGQPQTSGGYADVKPGWYRGRAVAVKELRVAITDEFEKIREVSGKAFAVEWDNTQDRRSLSPRNSARKSSFGIRYLIQTS